MHYNRALDARLRILRRYIDIKRRGATSDSVFVAVLCVMQARRA